MTKSGTSTEPLCVMEIASIRGRNTMQSKMLNAEFRWRFASDDRPQTADDRLDVLLQAKRI